MKIFISIFFLFSGICSFSQINNLFDEKIVKENHIKEYRMINRKIVNKVSSLDNRVMELNRFNKDGKIEYKYSFNVDIVYTIDSTLYFYDSQGNLTEKVNYYIDSPVGEEQISFVEELGGIDTTISSFKYFYNDKNQKIQSNEYEYGKLSVQYYYDYDSLGNLIQMEEKHYQLPKENNAICTLEYDSNNQLVRKKTSFYHDNNRIEVDLYAYDKNGKLIKKETVARTGKSIILSKYNDKGKLVEEDDVKGYVIEYNYDDRGNFIEKKEYKGKELIDWKKFNYNEKNLIIEEFWMDEKSGKVAVSILYEYTFY